MLQRVLAEHGVSAYVCNHGPTKISAGENWEDAITAALNRCTLMVVLGTKTYGAEGAETIDTKKELAFALRAKKDILVLKMTDVYAEPYAVMQLPSLQSIEWRKGGGPGGNAVPEEALEYITGRVQRVEVQVAPPAAADEAEAPRRVEILKNVAANNPF